MELTNLNSDDSKKPVDAALPGLPERADDDAAQRPLTVRELLAAIRQPCGEPTTTRQSHGFNVATAIACSLMLMVTASRHASALTTLNVGDTFAYTTGQNFADSFLLNGGTILPNASSTGGFNANLSGPVSVTATSTIRTGPVTANNSHVSTTNQLTLSGNITGSSDLILNTLGSTSTAASPGTDRGRITFSGNNSGYSGDVFLNNGILLATNSNALGTGDIFVTNNLAANGSVLNNGVALEISGNTTIANNITLAGTATLVGSTLTTYRATIQGTTGVNTLNGNIFLGGSSDFVIIKTAGNTAANNVIVNGNISLAPGGYTPVVVPGNTGGLLLRGGTQAFNNRGDINGNINIGAVALTKTDAATWSINSTGNTWGATILSAGNLLIGANNALPTATIMTINDVSGFAATTFDLSGFNQTIAGLTNTTTSFSGKVVTNSSANFSTLTINNPTSMAFGLTGGSATITGNMGLTKDGAGTFTLAGSGTNTFTGPVNVLGGTLALSSTTAPLGAAKVQGTSLINVGAGAFFDVSAVTGGFTLASGKTLAGNGTVIGNFATAAGSSIAPGASIGTLNFANNLDINGFFKVEIDGALGTADMVSVTGLLDVADATLDLTFLTLPTAPVYFLASYGTLAGTFNTFAQTLPSGISINYNFGGTNRIALVNANASAVSVPEPASLTLLALGGVAMLRRRRLA